MRKLHHITLVFILSFNFSFDGKCQFYSSDSLLEILSEQDDLKERAVTLKTLGDSYFLIDNDTAIFYYSQAYELGKKVEDLYLMAEVSARLGNCFYYTDPVKSAQYTLESVEHANKTEDAHLICYSRSLLGNTYRMNGELDKAMTEYKYTEKVSELAGDSLHLARSYNNIGIVHMMKGEYDIGLEYWKKSLDIKLQLGNETAAAATMSNIALYYKDIGRFYEAKEYLDRSLVLNLNNKDYESVCFNYTVIGDMYWRMDNPRDAEKAYKKSLAYADTTGTYYNKEDAFIGLSRVLDSLGNYEEALYYHRLYADLVKNQHSENNERITRELTTKFETEKKEKEYALLKGENETKDAKIQLKETNNKYLVIGLSLVGAILVLIFVVLARVRSAKNEIEAQKHIVEEKNREITDSITYAKRLQTAILPTEQTINSFLKENFVYYLPKDIVAGDFYWLEPSGAKVLFAVADCTGHGVPGAMVSVVCHNALNRAVREFGLINPGEILDKVTDLVIETFEKSTEQVRDGMDIGLCVFDFENNILEYAGANNSLYHISQKELIEIKPSKQPVGKHDNRQPFKTHRINFTAGDTFYLFTDGFADQFGGEKGKKMKYKPFKNLLVQNIDLSMAAQKNSLEQNFQHWRGDYEQIDDVCIAGIKV
jgi:serine phosphatase RsbU (regulator of sigma subunit)